MTRIGYVETQKQTRIDRTKRIGASIIIVMLITVLNFEHVLVLKN
jgi:hypothetical protein